MTSTRPSLIREAEAQKMFARFPVRGSSGGGTSSKVRVTGSKSTATDSFTRGNRGVDGPSGGPNSSTLPVASMMAWIAGTLSFARPLRVMARAGPSQAPTTSGGPAAATADRCPVARRDAGRRAARRWARRYAACSAACSAPSRRVSSVRSCRSERDFDAPAGPCASAGAAKASETPVTARPVTPYRRNEPTHRGPDLRCAPGSVPPSSRGASPGS